MPQNPIYTNSTIKIYAKIKDEDGNYVDPSGLDFYITGPGTGATTINYTYGDGVVLKSGAGTTGIYYVEYLPETAGRYKYTWEASGTIQAAFKSFFEVDDSRWN